MRWSVKKLLRFNRLEKIIGTEKLEKLNEKSCIHMSMIKMGR